MIRVRWTTHAADDLTRIVEYIRKDNPAAAQRVARTIYRAVAELRTFPQRGRIGLASDTRELIFSPLLYIAVYEIVDDQVNVLRIRHAAQDWP
ncbi:MAG TPA: type II toxin-antitoxin system RelE/ParE family toxin [Bryobacteraceae bacterium]